MALHIQLTYSSEFMFNGAVGVLHQLGETLFNLGLVGEVWGETDPLLHCIPTHIVAEGSRVCR